MLQLKNKTGITGGNDNATKGLGLPRVALVAMDDLAPAATSPADDAAHTGLTVYNTTDNSATTGTLKEGVYTWDGATWQPMGLKDAQGFGPWYQVANPTLPSREVDTNSYLNAKAAVGGTTVIDDASLSVHGNTNITGNNTVQGNSLLKETNISGGDLIYSKGTSISGKYLKAMDDKLMRVSCEARTH